ncbi:MAG: flagellar M-ring protein FliF C-terminal domain-containing protein, partial [Candidatus Sulfotelmatobacter sp.]
RTPDEMKQLEQLARAAIGVDPQRGDVLAVENISFQEIPLEIIPPPSKFERWRKLLEPWVWLLRYIGLAALFLVVYFLMLRPVKKQILTAFRELPAKVAAKTSPQTLSAAGVPIPAEGKSEGDGQRATQLKKMLTEKVKAEPVAASRLVESWVREEESDR